MARTKRTVAGRLQSLQPVSPAPQFSLYAARCMYAGIGGKEFICTVSGHCRTQVFEFPGIDLQLDSDEPYHEIFASPSVRACLATNLVGYFVNSTFSQHYAISPILRHAVGKTEKEIKRQQNGRIPVFLVIEEFNQLTPVKMGKGECSISDEVVEEDGERIPMLIGGREGEKFVAAWPTVDGAWPELPNNQLLVNTILAGVRAVQRTSGPISKYEDQDCLVTDTGRFVVMMGPTASGGVSLVTPMDATAYRSRVSEIRGAVAAMAQDIDVPHMALLFNSMYSDEHRDDSFQRLQYLGLWQSLEEAGRKYLNYPGNIKTDKVSVAGRKTLEELAAYRHDIAHWWTDTIDGNFLADLQRTINELVHRKYF